MLNHSVHEGEPLLVLLGDLSVEFLLQLDLSLLPIVILKGGLDVDSACYNCSNGLSQGGDLEEMGSSVETVEFFGIQRSDEVGEFLSDDVLNNVILDFRRLLDIIVQLGENLQDELEITLSDSGDLDLNKLGGTSASPRAMASCRKAMTLTWFSLRS